MQDRSRFSYIKYDEECVEMSEEAKAKFEQIEMLIELCPAKGRAQSLALTKLEETFMWFGKMVRDYQIQKNDGKFKHEPSRG